MRVGTLLAVAERCGLGLLYWFLFGFGIRTVLWVLELAYGVAGCLLGSFDSCGC